MRPEDLVGRRIRFLPKGRRGGLSTCHAMDAGDETTVTKCSSASGGVLHIHFERIGYAEYQHVRYGVDFEVIDDGEIPYSWRC